jgi:hypothetical protein
MCGVPTAASMSSMCTIILRILGSLSSNICYYVCVNIHLMAVLVGWSGSPFW